MKLKRVPFTNMGDEYRRVNRPLISDKGERTSAQILSYRVNEFSRRARLLLCSEGGVATGFYSLEVK